MRERTEETLRRFFDTIGEQCINSVEFVASDMWKPYLTVLKEKVGHLLHVLDRFHMVAVLLGKVASRQVGCAGNALSPRPDQEVRRHLAKSP